MAQLGIDAKREEDFGKWYNQVVHRADLIENYDISGCYILRPDSYEIWEKIQSTLDSLIKSTVVGGRTVRNAYFPLLVSQGALQKEENHIAGFAPEVAWVTKSGQSDMAEPVAVRPTSETIMYPAYKLWIRSHRDMPLRLNQWTNIVRWEFKDAVPFIRSREFLWQEGHSAFVHEQEAHDEVRMILDCYRKVYEDYLAVPVSAGVKSEKEKFAGAAYSTTCEAFIACNGRGVQACTSHHLGQNFSKMFDIKFEDENKQTRNPYQNSWGFTTRSIGVMIMVHGDNKGLVIPPRVAPFQVVIIPIVFKNKEQLVADYAEKLLGVLTAAGIRAMVDTSDKKPGFKHNHWELRGIPVRIEVGPKDVEKEVIAVKRRDELQGDKVFIPLSEAGEKVNALLDEIHTSLFNKAKADIDQHTVKCTKWEEFVPALEGKNRVLAPWCEKEECEEEIKLRSKEESEALAAADDQTHRLTGAAKSLCIPFEQEEMPEDQVCIKCGKKATKWTLFGRSY